LATAAGNTAREAVRAWAGATGIPPYDQREQSGALRHVVVREGIATGQLLVAVVTTPGHDDAVDALAPTLRAALPGLVGVVHLVSERRAEGTPGPPARPVWGRGRLEERVMGVTLGLSLGAFFQTNTRMAERLYGRVAEAAGLTGNEVLYDLFAGVG